MVPTNFTSSRHYVEVFEPLLHDEARASLVNTWQEMEAQQQPGGQCTREPEVWMSSPSTFAHMPTGRASWRVDVKDVMQQVEGGTAVCSVWGAV